MASLEFEQTALVEIVRSSVSSFRLFSTMFLVDSSKGSVSVSREKLWICLICLDKEVDMKTGEVYPSSSRQIQPKDQTSHFYMTSSFMSDFNELIEVNI
jgi:hypothetical protein